MKKLTTIEFIEKAKKVNGNKYDYSLVKYVGGTIKVVIICPNHQQFEQSPKGHLKGKGCIKCGGTKKLTTIEFIEKAEKVHGNKYDYSLVKYVSGQIKVVIIYPIKNHDQFEQTPTNHLQIHGCPKCAIILKAENLKMTQKDFIEKSKKVHGDKYDYSLVEYVGSKIKLNIICPDHQQFQQSPNQHLCGDGCPKCAGNKKLTTVEFIEKSKKVHGDKYDYSLVEYILSSKKVTIICPNGNHKFKQAPHNHLHGYGCSKCKNKTQTIILNYIIENFPFKIIPEKKFKWCLSKKENQLPFDWCIPELMLLIECDGRHHFKNIARWHSEFEIVVANDVYKMKCAMEHGYTILRIHQEDVWNNTFDWQTKLFSAIKTYTYPRMRRIAKDKSDYNFHIKLLTEQQIEN
jgi:Zn finger protein HypA/HybF involved in hydrogenase expression